MLNMTPISQELVPRIDKWNYMNFIRVFIAK